MASLCHYNKGLSVSHVSLPLLCVNKVVMMMLMMVIYNDDNNHPLSDLACPTSRYLVFLHCCCVVLGVAFVSLLLLSIDKTAVMAATIHSFGQAEMT